MHSDATERSMRILPSGPGGVVRAPSSRAFSAALASPLDISARKSAASSSRSTSILPRPLSLSETALSRSLLTLSLESGLSSNILDLDTRARLTSKYGFSVVAPMRMTVPSSTNGRR